MLAKTITFALLLLFLFPMRVKSIFPQQISKSEKVGELAAMRLENVHIKAGSMGQLLSRLSLASNIPIGFEIGLSDPTGAYAIDFDSGSLKDLLTQLTKEHDEYSWEFNEDVVNIFPKDNHRDVILRELLATQISRFSVKPGTDCAELEQSLVATPEIHKIIETHGLIYQGSTPDGFYIQQVGRDFTLDISNMTSKSILNRVIKESPVAKIWVIKRDPSDQTFYIRIYARLEYPALQGTQTSRDEVMPLLKRRKRATIQTLRTFHKSRSLSPAALRSATRKPSIGTLMWAIIR